MTHITHNTLLVFSRQNGSGYIALPIKKRVLLSKEENAGRSEKDGSCWRNQSNGWQKEG